ncbi:hypothetical protein NBZ79_09415 [Sneathiella marina]|uniref:Glycerophosphoryl diester phosphodiesterase membrane domain-containing protein n=1 Tax=Sneathiella marina TaxID=2950108 RepID=A0ABY4W7P2_9PROT|nr:hypothetical protein [Sneathiella marina]USG63193.1 hypothetical protein NBZ79_09415 [Sneathiella marina]
MYPQSFKLLVRLYPYVLLVIVCELIFGPFKSYIQTFGGELFYDILIDSRFLRYNAAYLLTLLAEALLIFKASEQILNVKNTVDIRWARQFGYFAVIWLLFHIPVLLQQVPYYIASMSNEVASKQDSIATGVNIFLFMLPIVILLFFLEYFLFGTWFPAIVDNKRGGLGTAFARGKQTFLFVMWRFLAGPTVLLITMSVLLYINSAVARYATDWQLLVPVTIVGILLDIFYCWILVMTAWILSKAYLKTKIVPEEGS